jgi:hypothetical protein
MATMYYLVKEYDSGNSYILKSDDEVVVAQQKAFTEPGSLDSLVATDFTSGTFTAHNGAIVHFREEARYDSLTGKITITPALAPPYQLP